RRRPLRAGGNLRRASGRSAAEPLRPDLAAPAGDQARGQRRRPCGGRGNRAQPTMTPIFLGLGSNTERELHLTAGLDALAEFVRDLRCSPVFESLPVGIKSGNFYNLVVSGRTELSLPELDRRLKFIEAD